MNQVLKILGGKKLIKKIGVLFLSGVICIATAGLALAIEYNEAPMLRTQVAAGELPPVEERLPEEPAIVKPIEKIGVYGDTWRMVHMGAVDLAAGGYLMSEPLAIWNIDFTRIMPVVVKGWKFSEDAKSITFYLRKGMKWSDGAPFTANDFVFYWNDILLNKGITPIIPANLRVGGEPGKIEKIDDYTFKLSFTKPYGMIIETFADRFGPKIYAPKHYLKQFHPKYTPMDEIKKIMKNEGFTVWNDLFLDRNTRHNNPKLPVIEAWYPLDKIDKPIQRWVRNPYYWKVDTKGNQLPYIDKLQFTLVSDAQGIVLKAAAGDIDLQWRRINFADYTFLMQNRKKGNYQIQEILLAGTNFGTLYLNFFHKDLILRKLFRDKRFRIALSIAINRNEMNELLFKGLATPAQPFPQPGTPWYVEEYCKEYTQYDPKKANELLDQIGLKKRDSENYRLRPDGKRLEFVISVFTPWPPENVEGMELVKEYWENIGIKTVVKPVDRALWCARVQACEHDVASYAANMGFAGIPPATCTDVVPTSAFSYWAPMWGIWVGSNGKSGEEPPVDIKRLMEIYYKISEESSTKKRIELNKETLAIHAKNLWMIGIVRQPRYAEFIVKSNRFRNVFKQPIPVYFFPWEQCFIKE